MKLRLQITAPAGPGFAFEHHGPVLRIGRDPSSELALQGEAGQTVSWNHAKIELTPGGAFLDDLNSSNGTFLNDRRVQERLPVKTGDQIRLGYTGPTLQVVELDVLAAPPPPPVAHAAKPLPGPAPERTGVPPLATAGKEEWPGPPPVGLAGITAESSARTPPRTVITLVAGGAGFAAVAVLLTVFLLKNLGKSREQEPPPDGLASTASTSSVAVHRPAPGNENGPDLKGPDTKATKKTSSLPVAEEPVSERQAVGTFVTPAKGPPSVLLQRQSDAYPWGLVRPGGPVYLGNYLVSLPGYRSKVFLVDSGIQLTLWGNVPEFSNFPPVLESTVMLNAPSPGVDVDLTLDHGRVHLANKKPQGEAHVRVRFLHEVWDLTLPDPRAEAVLELWGLYPRDVPFRKEPGGKGPLACLGLFVQGHAVVKIRNRDYQMGNLTQLTWSNADPEPLGPETLAKPPAWWTNQIAPDSPNVADVMAALQDFQTELGKNDAVVDAVATQVRESPFPPNRALGVLFLGALDAIPPLVEALEDRQNREVRGTAAFALRHWISRSGGQDLELYRMLHESKRYSKEKAEIILKLLHSVSEADAARPETYQQLLGYLNHDNLAIRELALWHLVLLAPQGASIPYDPASDAEKRKPAVEQWQRLIPPGKLPPRASPPRK